MKRRNFLVIGLMAFDDFITIFSAQAERPAIPKLKSSRSMPGEFITETVA